MAVTPNALYTVPDTPPPSEVTSLSGQAVRNYFDSDRLNKLIVFAETAQNPTSPEYAAPVPERSFWREIVVPRLGFLAAVILRPLLGSESETSTLGQQER